MGASPSALVRGPVQRHVYGFDHRAFLQVELVDVRLVRVGREALVLWFSRWYGGGTIVTIIAIIANQCLAGEIFCHPSHSSIAFRVLFLGEILCVYECERGVFRG